MRPQQMREDPWPTPQRLMTAQAVLAVQAGPCPPSTHGPMLFWDKHCPQLLRGLRHHEMPFVGTAAGSWSGWNAARPAGLGHEHPRPHCWPGHRW